MLRKFGAILSGGAIAQGITFLALPFLARIYGPVGFGILASVVSAASLLLPILHGRYHLAIPLVGFGQRKALLRLALGLSFLTSIFLAGPLGAVSAGSELGYGLAAVTTALYALTASWIEVLNYWRTTAGRWREASLLIGARGAVVAGAQFVLGALSQLGMVFGAIAGQLLIVMASLGDREVRAIFSPRKYNWRRNLLLVAKRHRGLPLYNAPQGLIASAAWNFWPIILVQFGSANLAGQYWAAYRLFMAPLVLLNSSYRQSALTTFGAMSGDKRANTFRNHSLILFGCGIFSLVAVYLISSTIVPLLLGPGWDTAGRLLPILWIGLLGELVKLPLMCVCQAMRKEALLLRWEMGITIVKFSGAAAAWLFFGNLVSALKIYFVLATFCWLCLSFYHVQGKKFGV